MAIAVVCFIAGAYHDRSYHFFQFYTLISWILTRIRLKSNQGL